MSINNRKLIYNLIQVYIMSLAFISVIIDFNRLTCGKTVYILSMLIMVALLFVIKKINKKYVSVIFMVFIFIMYVILKNMKFSIHNFSSGLSSYFDGGKISDSIHVNQYFTLYGIIISIIITLIFWTVRRFELFKDLIVFTLLVFCIIITILGNNVSNLAATLLSLLTLLSIARLINKIFNKRMYSNEIVESLMPLILIISMTALFLPHKNEPIDWSKIKTFFVKIAEKGSDLFNDFGFYFGGEDKGETVVFSDEKNELGGDLNQSDQLFFSLNGTAPEGSAYVVVKTNNIYTGNSWESDETVLQYSSEEYLLDYYETIEAFKRGGYETDFSDFAKEKYFTFVIANIRTDVVFNFTRILKIESVSREFDSSKTNMTFNSSIGKNDSYKIGYLDINYGNPDLVDFINQLDGYSYNERNGELYKLLNERSNYIYSNYLNVPENMPERVYKLAEEITKDCTTNYEKAKAIEEYLHKYKYTKTPLPIETEDFVDGFLFETKEGYCTYYASAMAILSRCVGIPSRYVEGYLCKFEETNENGYSVKGTDGHAWAEVYIEGFGWVPFEATSGYSDSRYTPWKKKSENFVVPESNYQPEPKTQTKEENTITDKSKVNYKEIIYYCIIICLTSFLMLFVIMKISKINKARRFNKGNNEIKAQFLLKDIISYYNYMGKKYEETMTPLEYKELIKGAFDCQAEVDEFINLYTRGRYSANGFQIEDIERLITLNKIIYEAFKKNSKWYVKLFV